MSLPDILQAEGRSFWADWLGIAGFAIALATLVVASWSVKRTHAIENLFLAVQRRARLRPLVSQLRMLVSKARELGPARSIGLEEAVAKLEKELQISVDRPAPESFASEVRRAILNLRQLQKSLRASDPDPTSPEAPLRRDLAQVHDSLSRIEIELLDDAERREWRGQQP